MSCNDRCCFEKCCTNCIVPMGDSHVNIPSLIWKNLELQYSDKYNTSNASKYDMVNRLQNNQIGIKYPPQMYSSGGPTVYQPSPPDAPYPGGYLYPEEQGNIKNWPNTVPGGDDKDNPDKSSRNAVFGQGFPVAPGVSTNTQFWTLDGGLGQDNGGRGSYKNIGSRLIPAPPPCPFRMLSFSQNWYLRNQDRICVYRKDNFPDDGSNSVFTPHIESWGLYTRLVGEFRFSVTIQMFNPSVPQTMSNLFGYSSGALPNFPTQQNDQQDRENMFNKYRQDTGGYNFSNDITGSSSKTFTWTVPVSIEYTPLDRNFTSTITRVIGSDTMQWTTEELPFINFKHLTTPAFLQEWLGDDFLGQNLSFNDILSTKMLQSGSYPSIAGAIQGGNFSSLKNQLFGFFSQLIETLFLHNGKIAASFSFTKNSNSSPCTWTGPVFGQGQSLYMPTPRMKPCPYGQVPTRSTQPLGDEDAIESDLYNRNNLVNYFIPTTGTPIVCNNFPFGTCLVCGYFGNCGHTKRPIRPASIAF